MKTTFYFLFGFLVLLSGLSSFAMDGEIHKYISPVIGDSLDQDERKFYKLFPKMKEFIGAVFYIEQDSQFFAKVYYQDGSQLNFNIYENYMAGLANFNHYLEQMDKVSASARGGEEITVYLTDDQVLIGELISVRQNSILLFPEGSDIDLIDNSNLITVLNENDILKIEITNSGKFFSNCLFSIYTGGTIGLLPGIVSYAIAKNKSESNVVPAIIATIGFFVGTIIAYLIISDDDDNEIITNNDFSDIKEYARFKSFEPIYLRSIK